MVRQSGPFASQVLFPPDAAVDSERIHTLHSFTHYAYGTLVSAIEALTLLRAKCIRFRLPGMAARSEFLEESRGLGSLEQLWYLIHIPKLRRREQSGLQAGGTKGGQGHCGMLLCCRKSSELPSFRPQHESLSLPGKEETVQSGQWVYEYCFMAPMCVAARRRRAP